MALESLPYHADYKALPAQATSITPDNRCVGCGFAQATGHKSCETFKLQNRPAVTADNRINLKTLRQIKTALHMKAFAYDGVVAAENGFVVDSWYYNNAGKAINFTYFSSWKVISIVGKNITLEPVDPDDDPLQVIYATWTEREQVSGLGFTISGHYSVTSVQPLDMINFQYPSLGAVKLTAKIMKVVGMSGRQVTWELDKETDCALTFLPVAVPDTDPVEYADDPDYVTVKIHHYGREEEQWKHDGEPFYFLGKRTIGKVEAAELPEDKIWQVHDGVICPAKSVDPLQSANWVLEGFDGTNWVIIHEDDRLHIRNSDGARVALGTTLPADSVRSAPGTDLTATYERFRATFYVETTAADANCSVRGYDRCFHSRVEASNSVHNYGTRPGLGVDGEGRTVYCSKRVYPVYTEVDDFNRLANPPAPGSDGIPDRVTVELVHPAGLPDYPNDSGKCIQDGYCEKWENTLDHLGENDAPFNGDYVESLRQIWFSTDKRRVQKYVLAQGSTGYTVERVGVPAILNLVGYYRSLTTPGGWHPEARFRGDNSWSTQEPVTVVDADGNESLVMASGLELGYVYEPDTESVDPDRVAALPATVTGFKTKRDPFDPAATVEEDLLEYVGAQIERDTGIVKESRGLSQISVALGEEDILAPNFDLGVFTLQQGTRANFLMESPVADAVLKILPYRQEAKPEVSLGARTGYSMAALGSNRYWLEMENETRTFSRFSLGDLGTIGDSYDQIFTVAGGGVWPFVPPEPRGLFSYDGDKTTGSRRAGLQPLDVVEVGGKRFIVETVEPHAGSEAATWGNKVITNKGGIGGFFELPVDEDEGGNPYLPVFITAVTRVADSQAFAVVNEAEKPVLEVNQAWFDGNKRLYWTTLNDGDTIKIEYLDEKANSYTEYFTITPAFTVQTETDYSEWTGATARTVYIGATAATITVGGAVDPAVGEVRINDVSGKISLTFHIDDAPTDWKLVLQFDTDAPAPEDDWAAAGNYTAFGKKRDACIVRSDFGASDWLASNTVAGESCLFYRSAAVFVPNGGMSLSWTVQGSDGWQTVPVELYRVNAASGTITIQNAFFTENFGDIPAGKVCFRVNDIQMVDHRGFVPASFLNKTLSVVDGMVWMKTYPGSGFGDYTIDKFAQQNFSEGNSGWNPATETCETTPDGELFVSDVSGYTGNVFYVEMIDGYSQAYVHSTATSFGMLEAFKNLPDGIVINEAIAILGSSGLVSARRLQESAEVDCEGNVVTPDVNPEGTFDYSYSNVSHTVIAFTGANSFIKVGSIAGVQDHTTVSDFTDVAKWMYAHRNDPAILGYGLIFSPVGMGEDDTIDISSYIKKGPLRVVSYCSADQCHDVGDPRNEWYQYTYHSMTWTNASIGEVFLNLNWNGKDKLALVQPRLPSFANLT